VCDDLGDRGDARERLAAKTERPDGEKVFGGRELARGVALEGERERVGWNAAAGVDDPDEAEPAAANLDLDAMRPAARRGAGREAGVDGVLDEFLDRVGRSGDDLAGRDLERDVFGEQVDRAASIDEHVTPYGKSGGSSPS
jgi:hypothetical protein